MKKLMLTVLSLALMAAVMLLCAGCGEKYEAVLKVSSRYETTMECLVDPDGDEEEAAETEPETFTVKSGDVFFHDSLKALKVGRDFVTIKTDFEFMGRTYGVDGYLVKDFGIAQEFTVKKGETLSLEEAYLDDASHTVKVIFD